MEHFKVLFNKDGSPMDATHIRSLVSKFSESYEKVVRKVITNSATLSVDSFRFNVATLLPSFKMTRRGAFHGLKIVDGKIQDPNCVLDTCWMKVDSGLQELKKYVSESTSDRSRAILELSPESQNSVIGKASKLFEKLKWTSINGSDVGRVGASKILFVALPEIALPVDNAEWDSVFRTDNYGKVLSTMIAEVSKWEAQSEAPFESLDSKPTTVPSIYNVMAMEARPKE